MGAAAREQAADADREGAVEEAQQDGIPLAQPCAPRLLQLPRRTDGRARMSCQNIEQDI